MTTTETTAATGIEFKVGKNQSSVNFNGAETFAIASSGDVTAFADDGVQTKPAEAAPAQTADYLVAITPDLKSAALNGAKVALTADVPVVSTDGSVRIRPAAEGAAAEAGSVEFKVEKDLTTLNIQDTKFEVAPNSDVTVYLKEGESVQTKPADERVAAADAADPSVRISPDFNAAATYGARVKVTAEGPVVSTNGKVRIKPAAPVVDKVSEDLLAILRSLPRAFVTIGEKDEDGWVFAGKSPDTGKAMFVAPQDTGVLTYDDAEKAAKDLCNEGVTEARVPSKAELKVIFKNAAAIGGFNTTNHGYDSRYWSTARWGAIFPGQKVTQGFAEADKVRSNGHKSVAHSTRLVRS